MLPGSAGQRAGELDEALERVAQMPDALQVMAERVRLRPGADDEHVARAQAAIEAPIEQNAITPAGAGPDAMVTSPTVISTMLRGISSA